MHRTTVTPPSRRRIKSTPPSAPPPSVSSTAYPCRQYASPSTSLKRFHGKSRSDASPVCRSSIQTRLQRPERRDRSDCHQNKGDESHKSGIHEARWQHRWKTRMRVARALGSPTMGRARGRLPKKIFDDAYRCAFQAASGLVSNPLQQGLRSATAGESEHGAQQTSFHRLSEAGRPPAIGCRAWLDRSGQRSHGLGVPHVICENRDSWNKIVQRVNGHDDRRCDRASSSPPLQICASLNGKTWRDDKAAWPPCRRMQQPDQQSS